MMMYCFFQIYWIFHFTKYLIIILQNNMLCIFRNNEILCDRIVVNVGSHCINKINKYIFYQFYYRGDLKTLSTICVETCPIQLAEQEQSEQFFVYLSSPFNVIFSPLSLILTEYFTGV